MRQRHNINESITTCLITNLDERHETGKFYCENILCIDQAELKFWTGSPFSLKEEMSLYSVTQLAPAQVIHSSILNHAKVIT